MKVVVMVTGGIAYLVEKPKGVSVQIIDHDACDESGEAEVMTYPAKEVITQNNDN
jgi:hypothetical protein